MDSSSCANKNQIAVNNEDVAASCTDPSSAVNMNQVFPESCTEDQAAAAALISTELNQTYDQTNQGTEITESLKIGHGQENLPKIPVCQNINGDENKLVDSKDMQNLEMSNGSGGTEDKNSKLQSEERVPENLLQNSKEIAGLSKLNSDGDLSSRNFKCEHPFSKGQVSESVSQNDPDGKIFSDSSQGILCHKTPVPVGEKCQIFDVNPKELEKAENVASVDKQELKDSETMKEQPERRDNSKTKIFTPNNEQATNVINGNHPNYNTENDTRILGRMNVVELKANKPCQQANPTRAPEIDNASKKTSFSILPQVSTDHLTNPQPSHLGKSLVSGQTLSEPNRTLQPIIKRQNDLSNPLQIRAMTYLNNSGQASSQNNFSNEMKLKNPINIYSTNQNKNNINQIPLNMIDTRSKSIGNNLPSQIRPGVHNLRQQPNQSIVQPIRLSNLPNKKNWESEFRFQFPTATGINSRVSHNQRPCYTRYDVPSSQYVLYSDNGNITRNNFCNRTSAMGNIANNNSMPIQKPDLFSEHQFQQNINQFRSPYFFMWPAPGDQTIGTDKLTMTQPYSTPGIISSYQQPPNNILPNPVKDYNLYSKPVSINDAKRNKNQFLDGDLNLLTSQQNFEERKNLAIGHTSINRQQESLQSTQRTYNTIGQTMPLQQSEIFVNRGNDNTFPMSQNSIQREQSPGYLHYHSGQTENELKVTFPASSPTNQQFLAQGQGLNSNFQKPPYDQYQHYYPGFQIPKANRCSLPNTLPPPKTQNITYSNFQTGCTQRPASSVSNIQNPEVPTFPGQTMTLTTATISTTLSTSLSSTKVISKTTDSSNREESLLDNGQHSGPQRPQNKFLELGVSSQPHSLTKYPNQLNVVNNSKIRTQLPASNTNTIQPNYSKDAYALTSSKGQTLYNANDSDGGILGWSQHYPQNFDPARPLQSSQRGYVNYDPIHKDRNLNFQQQNINYNFYAPQSYDNYMQQVVPSNDPFQGVQRPQISLNPVSTGSNDSVAYNNVNATVQNFGNFQTENQPRVSGEKFHVLQEINSNTTGEQVSWKSEGQEKNLAFPTQLETSTPKPAGSDQFQNYNLTNNTCPKATETSPEMEKSLQTLLPTTTAGTSTKASDLLSKALSHPHLGMTSEESFLFSDFDPLFTSSLLTNDLDYFPENNSAFDQCFEDAASITMATLTPNEARTQQNVDTVDSSQVPASQQEQFAPFLNTPSNKTTGSSASNISLLQIPYNQIPPSQTHMESIQVKNPYDYSAGDGKNLVPLTNKQNQSIAGYVPEADISIFSMNMGISSFAKNSNICPNDSIMKRFSDRCTSKTASQLAKPITDYKSEEKRLNKNGQTTEQHETGAKKRNRQKKERSLTDLLPQENVKKPKKKTVAPKGPPRPRGRPPKNKFQGNTCSTPPIPATQGVIIDNLYNTKQIEILNTRTVAFGNDPPKPINNLPDQVEINYPAINIDSNLNIQNSLDSRNSSKEVELPEYVISKNPNRSDKSDDKTPSNESFLLSEESAANSSSTPKTHHELSDREVIDVVTKCLESISRKEDKSSDKIKDYQLDVNSENLDDSRLVGMESQSGGDDDSPENQALSREEMLMKAYIELKKKLEERMNRSLWRQSYLKHHEPKDKSFRKLSKKECMTAYSGTTSLGPENDLFSRYSNRSSANINSKLVATADSTSLDSNPDKQIENSNQENLEIIDVELIENLDRVTEKKLYTDEPLISSTDVSKPKDKTSKIGTTLRLPSMMEVVRTRLTDELPLLDTSHSKLLDLEAPKEQTEALVPIENVQNESSETGEISPNLEKKIPSNDVEQVQEPENGNLSQEQSEQPPPTRHSALQPYSPSPLLPPPPPPPLPPQVTLLPSNREKTTPRKVGPTIVENAKICFEAIGKYLTKADSDFDSFLISYANIVQGLLNCGSERYGRIKAILKPQPVSNELIPQKSIEATETVSDNSSPKKSFEFHQDIDAADIQGDAGSQGENTIDVEDFNSSYADIVKIILSSRADEYRNIKQALSRNICGGTDVAQGLTKSAGKSKSDYDANYEISENPLADRNEAGSATLTKVKRKSGKKTQDKMSESPSQFLKKQNKRKTKEKKDGTGMKSKVTLNNETMEPSRKQTPKRKSKKTQDTSTDKKQSSFQGKTKASGFRIILSSNYFAEQKGKDSNLGVKSKISTPSIEENYEDLESRLPLSSDDGFVEESTGDYVMGLGFESGDEKSETAFHIEPLRMDDEQTFGNIDNITKTVEKPDKWYEAAFKTETNDLSLDFNADKVADCKDDFSSGDPKGTIEDFNAIGKVSSETTVMSEEKKRQRPTRKAASAGVGALRCPCGCCDDRPSLRDKSVENRLRDLTMSFKNRNRAKIIRPKSASITKKRGRPRKMDKSPPQKIISKLWTDISATEESDENQDVVENLSDDEESEMPENLCDTHSVRNMFFQVRAKRNNTVNDVIERPESYLNSYSDSDKDAFADIDVLMNLSEDSDSSWKPKVFKNGKREILKRGQNLDEYNLLNIKTSLIGVCDSQTDDTDKKATKEGQGRKTETTSEKDEKNPLNMKMDSQTSIKLINESSVKEFSRDEDISKQRISFKDFVPNLKLPPLPKAAVCNPEILNETNPELEIQKSGFTEISTESRKIFTENVSKNIQEPRKSFKYLNPEQNEISSNADGGVFLSNNNAKCNNQTEINSNHQISQTDTSVKLKADDCKDLPKKERDGEEDSKTENVNEDSKKPEETISTEERLRSLIEKITEINVATKRLNTNPSTSVRTGSENIDKNSNKNLQSLDADFETKDGEEMKVKTELLDRIDESMHCPIGMNDLDGRTSDSSYTDSSSISDSNCSQNSEWRKKGRDSMFPNSTQNKNLEVKMPSPLNPRKKKRYRIPKAQPVRFENKIIIRKKCLEKRSKKNRNLQKQIQKNKNIFDIMSQNETEDEDDDEGKDIKLEKEQSSGCFSDSVPKKSEVYSVIFSGVSKSGNKTQKTNSTGKSTTIRATKKASTINKDSSYDNQQKRLEIFPKFSENAKLSTENNLEILKKKRKRRNVKSFLNEAKILVEPEGVNNSNSYSEQKHTNVFPDSKILVDDNLEKILGVTSNSKTKTKKATKKLRTELNFLKCEEKPCLSFDTQRGKKRKKSMEPENSSILLKNKEKESDNLRCNKKTKIDELSSDQDRDMSLMTNGSFFADDGTNAKRKRVRWTSIDRPILECSYCQKTFKKPSELLYHTRSHTGVRPFACNQCDKSFVSNAHLLRHQRTHSTEPRHVCPTCGRGFTQHYGMVVHQLIHSGIKPHNCPDCSKTFRTKGCLGTHRRKHHPEQIAKEKIGGLQNDPPDSK